MDIFVLGDAIAQGARASRRECSFIHIVCERLEASPTSFCWSEATSATGAEWVDYITREPRPDLVIVAYGRNDQTLGGAFRRRVQVTPEAYYRNIVRIIDSLRERWADIDICLVVPPPRRPGWRNDSGLYRAALATAADQHDCRIAIPNWNADTDLYAETNHPNDRGHALLAEAVLSSLDT